MSGFIAEYGGTVVVAAALAVIVALIVVRLVRNHRSGCSDCGCECCKGKDGCPGAR
jgi:hypothetical protein